MILAGDIGGTKTVLGLFDAAHGVGQPLRQSSFPSQEYDALETIVASFLTQDGETPVAAIPSLVKPLVGGTTPLAVVQPETEEELIQLATQFAGIDIGVYGFDPQSYSSSMGAGTYYSSRIKFYGYNLKKLREIAADLEKTLKRNPRIREVRSVYSRYSWFRGDTYENVLRIDKEGNVEKLEQWLQERGENALAGIWVDDIDTTRADLQAAIDELQIP